MKVEGNQSGIKVEVDATTKTDGIRVISVGEGNEISIGKNCRIQGHFYLANGACLRIGDSLTCTSRILCHLHEGSSVEIGDNCLFASEVSFRPSDAHKIFDLETNARVNNPSPIRIGDRVWIGENALVLKGASVGNDSVVGARSVVSGRFDKANCLIAGQPARIVREGIRWEA
ncbi:DapH/DapD/GlmU-related protein [Pseudophaeobacter sp. 1A09344]|uniref:acyltransferase n=1 Tax=Pseudophaeobacter sp. 1A09344 TaxID=3098144 RepID=UPI0034D5B318